MMSKQPRVATHPRWYTSRTEFVGRVLAISLTDPLSDHHIKIIVGNNPILMQCETGVTGKFFAPKHPHKGKPLLIVRDTDCQPLTFLNGLIHPLWCSMRRAISIAAHHDSASKVFEHRLSRDVK
jgi:hypothetical protein